MENVVNAEWARKVVAAIERAVREWNSAHQQTEQSRVVWVLDKDERTVNALCQFQEGILHHRGMEFDLTANHPGLADRLLTVAFASNFTEPAMLPSDPESLFNASACISPNAQWIIVPWKVEDGSPAIAVMGVKVSLYTDTLSGPVLNDALTDLLNSFNALEEWLHKHIGDDYWSIGGGIQRQTTHE